MGMDMNAILWQSGGIRRRRIIIHCGIERGIVWQEGGRNAPSIESTVGNDRRSSTGHSRATMKQTATAARTTTIGDTIHPDRDTSAT